MCLFSRSELEGVRSIELALHVTRFGVPTFFLSHLAVPLLGCLPPREHLSADRLHGRRRFLGRVRQRCVLNRREHAVLRSGDARTTEGSVDVYERTMNMVAPGGRDSISRQIITNKVQ